MEPVVDAVIETIESDSRFPTDEIAQQSVRRIKEAWTTLDTFIDSDKFQKKHREFNE